MIDLFVKIIKSLQFKTSYSCGSKFAVKLNMVKIVENTKILDCKAYSL